MQIFKFITVGILLAASLLRPVLGVGVKASKVGQVKLLGEHSLSVITSKDGSQANHELKARDTSAVSGDLRGLFGGLQEAAQDILGRHDGHDDASNILVIATSAIQTVTIQQTCGTYGTLITSASTSGSYLHPKATTIKICPAGSCYNSAVSQPTGATFVPGTIILPDTTINAPTTTNAPKHLGSTIDKQSTVSFMTTNTMRNVTNTISDGTPTNNYRPVAPPAVSSPVTGAASKKGTSVYLGGALVGLLL